jgi:predicted metal-dependent hydrolase
MIVSQRTGVFAMIVSPTFPVFASRCHPFCKPLQIVASKRQWIFEKIGHPQKYRERPHAPGKELVSGESALYLGREYRIEMVTTGLAQIQFAQRFFIPATPGGQPAEALRRWYVDKAKEKIVPRVQRHARELGVAVADIKIVDTRYRWGSCTPKNKVHINWRLVKAPMFVIDYVIVHELAHFIEANHTPKFWNIVRTQAPSMEKAKVWLKEQGALLEQAI